MTDKTVRQIVLIDEDKCNGCGECVPSCAEGAIEIIDGKARLLADNLCDGLGNCLGTCPQDAITIAERPADAFDEQAVAVHIQSCPTGPTEQSHVCPGMKFRQLGERGPTADPAAAGEGATSQLTHWPVQLTLLPEQGPIWDDTDVLLSADCVAYAAADFHSGLLAGRTLAIACPKLDDGQAYVDKLARIFAANDIRSITVARMEVPCCGLDAIVREALTRADKPLPVTVVTISTTGERADAAGRAELKGACR
ncbi:hypothetical protein LCGC14_0397690 [marine sediment metagenome]|uniref:4Fe-4S ferredoxin-type domain-containing protein n=1 Tax=marine sediment metagenome TaxID=412755 RepID=A0A0F9W6Q0_9ZZZZ|nr:4Fe-4S ferredoxin [Phycisphaerae bacterium]HDZ42634.1 4Fe-4S ferredoxin [Phycisphaerae bacterium]